MSDIQNVWLLILLMTTGAFAGILAGLLGVGGGIIIVPILYHLFTAYGVTPDVAMPLAVGTSLATIVFTSIISARKHYAKGGVNLDLVKSWVIPVLLGVIIGSFAPVIINGPQIKTVFGIMLTVVSLHMLASNFRNLTLSSQLPGQPIQRLLATILGGLSSMLGIGGGTLMVPLLTMFSFPVHRAVSTASVFGLIISVPATLIYILNGLHVENLPAFSTGYVNWIAFILIVPMSMWFAPLGVRMAYALNVSQLKTAFSVFLFLVGIKMTLF